QFLEEYVFLTPGAYLQDYINLTAPLGTQLTLDGAPVAQALTPVGGSLGMGVLQLSVQDGVHTVSGSASFGLTVYGYDCDVSYAYPGGLRLKTIQ
ncbi:MAG: IgGFc-binding protein, partial [Deltaproteobacteria bacterium]|nr:IgGFc-binding protein [Deltaproteobacteria bacterium]